MPLSGTRILLVEDDGIIAMLLKSMLTSLKCDVVGLAVRVPDALKKVAALSFDLVLLDVNLAGTLSYPVAEALVKLGIPFIFTTSYGRAALPPDMVMSPVLSKPFDLPQLSEALVALKQGQAAGLSRPAPGRPGETPQTKDERPLAKPRAPA